MVGKYVTPKSEAILASITNKSLMEIAADEGHSISNTSTWINRLLGLEVEMRPIHIDEVASFQEVAACGTAVGTFTSSPHTIASHHIISGDSSEQSRLQQSGDVLRQWR